MLLSRVPGRDRLFVGGVWSLNMESGRQQLHDEGVTHVLSVIKYSFDQWGDEAKRFPHHLSIDIDDDEDMDLLAHFPDAVRFIDQGLYPPGGAGEPESSEDATGTGEEAVSPGAVYVHCAMGKSRSVSCVVAYLLWKYPHRFSGDGKPLSSTKPSERRAGAKSAVERALQVVREGRFIAEPNDGFMEQLRLWWIMACPAGVGAGAAAGAQLENHPVYQKWLYERLLKEARDAHMPPDAGNIRFEDEVQEGDPGAATSQVSPAATGDSTYNKEVRCKKCRRTLATPKFVLSHTPSSSSSPAGPACAHVFIDTLSWMRPALEDGALEGRLNCPNAKCGATIGRFAWQGMMCSCKQWVVPAFSLNRSRVDELVPRPAPVIGVGGGGGGGGGRGSAGNL